jgi:excisionase family DNA binding protein
MENSTKEELKKYLDKFDETIQDIRHKSIMILKKIDDIQRSKIDNKLISGKKKAAEIADCSAQYITKLIDEGRLINYGTGGRDYRFKYSELLDLREVRVAKD